MNPQTMPYNNRELSWLAFNERVLEEAEKASNPLLERLKFTAIFSSNLDEFFMIRVAGLKEQIEAGYEAPDPSGLTPKQQLEAISKKIHELKARQYARFEELKALLENQGIGMRTPESAPEELKESLSKIFHRQIFPVLTPMAIDPTHPFPFLYSRTLNILYRLSSETRNEKQAIVPVPGILPRFYLVEHSRKKWVFLIEDLISFFSEDLFPGYRILEKQVFRITRNADLSVDEEGNEDLLKTIKDQLKERKRGSVVRLQLQNPGEEYLTRLMGELEIESEDLYPVKGPLDLTFLFSLTETLSPFMPDESFKPFHARNRAPEDFFAFLKKQDLLLHHPYESFEPVIEFLKQAAEDPRVLAIKQTLYRSSGQNSRVVEQLLKAAENNKQVTVLLEIKARFDEEKNISWAHRLEEAGCHVIYGVRGLKTHAKALLVVRKEEDGRIKRYMHFGTGNYNEKTAGIYTDLSYMSSNDDLALDTSSFFNFLTGYSIEPEWQKIVIAPTGIRKKILSLIENEIQKTSEQAPGRIIAKMNSLVDPAMIQKLYEASQAGVEIDLIVRGICCLQPGIPGFSENIRVKSIVGRFLEHSRIFYFKNAGDEKIYLSSADWMPRNLDRRIEIMIPIEGQAQKDRVYAILEANLTDHCNSRILQGENYAPAKTDAKQKPFSLYQALNEI